TNRVTSDCYWGPLSGVLASFDDRVPAFVRIRRTHEGEDHCDVQGDRSEGPDRERGDERELGDRVEHQQEDSHDSGPGLLAEDREADQDFDDAEDEEARAPGRGV